VGHTPASGQLLKSSNYLLVAGTAWASRILLALLQVASIRLLTIGLGQEFYAVYALLLGLAGWFTLADLGISSALQNQVSESRARGGDYATTLATWSMIAIAGGAVLTLAAWLVSPWLAALLMQDFPGVPADARVNATRIMAVASISMASGSLIYKVWYGEQRGYLAHLCQLTGGVLAYAMSAWILHHVVAHRLEWCLFAWCGINALLPLGFLMWRTKGVRWPARDAWTPAMRGMARKALGFWGYGLMAALVLQLDYVLVARLLGAADLISYSIHVRIFGLGFFVYASVLAALWPALTERAVQGRGSEMLAVAVRPLVAGLAFMALFTTFIAMFDERLLAIIAPTVTATTTASFILSMGAYYLVRIWTDTFSVMLQSMGQLRPFYLLVPVQAVVSIASQIAGVRWLGLPGIPLGMGLSFLLTVAWAAPMLVRQRSRGLAPSA